MSEPPLFRDWGEHHFNQHVRGPAGWPWKNLEPNWQALYERNSRWCFLCQRPDVSRETTGGGHET